MIAGISIEELRPNESERLLEFEKENRQPIGLTFPQNLIEIGIVYSGKVLDRHKQFDQFKVMVAKEQSTDKIVGVVSAVIKKALVDNQRTTVAQLFGLKVLRTFQGRGIAIALCKSIEAALIEAEVELLYIKIESSNLRANALFSVKLGYEEACYQKVKVLEGEKTIELTELSLAQAKDKTREFYGELLFTVNRLEKLFESSNYLGTYIVESGSTVVGASVWRTEAFVKPGITKVVFDEVQLKKPLISLWVMAAVLLVVVAFFYLALKIYSAISAGGLRFFYVVCLIVCGYHLIYSAYVIVRSVWTCAWMKPEVKGKVFGQFYFGPADEREGLFRELARGLKQVALKHKIPTINYEYLQDDVADHAFLTYDFSRLLLEKSLTDGRKKITSSWFLDPKD